MMKRGITVLVMVAMLFSTLGLSAHEGHNEDPRLVAVGSLSASNLYISYLILGTIADGFTSGSYDKDTTRNITLEIIFLNENTQSALRSLIQYDGIVSEEVEIIEEMLQAYTLLEKMAQGIISLVEDEDNGSFYRVFRQEAWEKISMLLNL